MLASVERRLHAPYGKLMRAEEAAIPGRIADTVVPIGSQSDGVPFPLFPSWPGPGPRRMDYCEVKVA